MRANTIGLTGPGFGLEAMTLSGRRAWRAYFSGQDLAVGAIAVPLLTAVSFGLAAVAGHPVDGLTGMAVDLAGIGAALALANILTAALAYPVEKRAGNPAPRPATGYMGHSVAGTFGGLISVALLVLPVIIGGALWHSAPAGVRLPVIAVCAACYGLALAWVGVQIAARIAEPKLPELYQTALQSKL